MTHIFNDKQFKKLESPARRKSLPIEKVIDLMAIGQEATIADVGCGIGYFAFPFSKRAKKVYAIDISQVMIDELNKRNDVEKIIPLLGDFNDLLEEKVDIFFTSTLIHELEDLQSFTKDAIQHLSPNGRLVFLDFRKKETGMGPDVDKRIASEDLKVLFEEYKLRDVKIHYINDIFYMVEGKL